MNEKELENDVKKLLGLKPFDNPTNFCWNDNYYAKSLNDKYGSEVVEKEIKRLTSPKQ